jgi:hypothetical protein
MTPAQQIDLAKRQLQAGLLTYEEFLMKVAQAQGGKGLAKEMMPTINRDLKYPLGGRGKELYQTKGSGEFRVRPLRAVDPEKSARAAERFREMWMRRQNLNPLLTKAKIAGGIPSLIAGYAGSQAYEKYPEEEEILAELEAIAGQKDDSRRKAIERAWIRNIFGRLANE